MSRRIQITVVVLSVVSCLSFNIRSANGPDDQDIYPEKRSVLDYLGRKETVERFGKISDSLWAYPELGLEEFRSAGLLTKELEASGFNVQMGLAGMPTCFVATYGSGKPVIGILAEYDALPMISQRGRIPYHDPVIDGAPGHGCGHNMMGTASIAAAIAVRQAMESYQIEGTIKVFGSPAEENLVSRPYMIRAGLFDDVDVVIDNHSGSIFGTGYGVSGSALFSAIFSFKGKTAHGASAWNGRSALDAVELMNVATNYLREHLHYSHRMHYVILEGGQAPNVVPDKASVWYFVRNSDERVEEMYERVVNCARAAALATDTQLEEIRVLTAIHQRHSNRKLAELFQRNIELVGMPSWDEEEQEFAKALQKNLGVKDNGMPEAFDSLKGAPEIFVGGGSSDVGDVTLIAPTATIRFPGIVPGAISHHWSTVSCTYGSAAWKGLIAGAGAIAASAIDLLTRPADLQEVRNEFEEYSAKKPYTPFLPDDALPPLGLNRDNMERWRPALERQNPE